MRLVTAPTRSTLDRLGLEPGKGLGDTGPEASRRASLLAFHLNRWVLGKTGGSADRPWLGTLSGFGGYPLAEFRYRLAKWDRLFAETPDLECFGWEFLLTANAWRSSRDVDAITVVHAGFEKEKLQLAEETGMPATLAESMLRSWLQSLYACSANCHVHLISLHDTDNAAPCDPSELRSLVAGSEELAESDLNTADPLPPGNWRLLKGSWDHLASQEDQDVTDAMRRLGSPSVVEVERALAHGRDPVLRAVGISPQTFRDARNIELRGIDRIQKERNKRYAERGQARQSQPNDGSGNKRHSFQVGRCFSHLLKRIFSGKRSS